MKKIKKIDNFFSIIRHVVLLLWKSSKVTFIKTVVVSILSGITVPLTIIIWKELIDSVSTGLLNGYYWPVIICLAIYFLLNYVDRLLFRIKEYYQDILASYLTRYTSDLILNKISHTELRFFDDPKTYDKIKKVNEESTGRSISILTTVTNFIQSFSNLIGTIAVLANLNIFMLFLCVLVCVPTLIMSMRVAAEQYDIYTERFESLRYISSVKEMATSYENVKEMKVYGVNDFFKRNIFQQYTKYIVEDKRIRKGFCIKLSATDFIEDIAFFFFKMYIAIDIMIKRMTIGDFSLYINAIDNFKASSSNILNTIASIFEDGLYIQNLFEFIGMKNIEPREEGVDFDWKFREIECKNIWFRYPGSSDYTLRNISLKLSAKKCYAIVGLNGSGKTTLIKLLLKLYEPDKGEILVDGINLKNINTSAYQKAIGVVFQDFVKYPLSVMENIGCGDISNVNNLNKIQKAAKISGADCYITKLPEGYKTQLQREWSGGIELSLGQWQKIAISRAFMKKFPIIILDEPTASLDPQAEYEIYQEFRELVKDRMSILIAHRLSTVKLADQILVLKNGEIIETGTHNELMDMNGEYAVLYNMQSKAYKAESEGGNG